MSILLALSALTGTCTAIDGDTLRCRIADRPQLEHIRLLAIDAPELPGHCRKGRRCVKGDPYRATRVLANAVRGQTVTLSTIGRDRWGRLLATARTGRAGDLSCHLLRQGVAEYVRHWDTGRPIARTCPVLAR